MKKLTVICVIFVLFLFGSLMYIGLSIQKQNKPYKSFESDLKEIAQTYILTNRVNIAVGGEYELLMSKMIEDNMLSINKVNEDECDGYVLIKRNISGYEYKPQIKCKNYESLKD